VRETPLRGNNHPALDEAAANDAPPGKGLESLDEVSHLLKKLPEKERAVVKLYFLEGHSYEEIAQELDIPMNSIGPILSRARKRMREGVVNPPPEVRRKAPPEDE